MNEPSQITSFSHIGVCVADLERAKRFYVEAFDFTVGLVYEMEDTINDLLGIPSKVLMTSMMLHKGSQVVELIHFKKPEAIAVAGLRPMNQLGLTHLSFAVEDVDGLAARVEALGGKYLAETRTVHQVVDCSDVILLFCTDPDGTRIELYRPAKPLLKE